MPNQYKILFTCGCTKVVDLTENNIGKLLELTCETHNKPSKGVFGVSGNGGVEAAELEKILLEVFTDVENRSAEETSALEITTPFPPSGEIIPPEESKPASPSA